MLELLIGAFAFFEILGSQDYNLQPLDPRTVVEELGKKQAEGKLTLTIAQTFIDFGTILPTNQVVRENKIEVKTNPKLSYSIVAFEDNPLILDTTCDDGACNEKNSSVWANPLAYGFGLSLDGSRFKQFANVTSAESKQAILTGRGNQEFKIIYKLNISKTQAPGAYTNVINYILIPSF